MMKRLTIGLVVIMVAASAVAAMFAGGIGVIEVGDNLGFFQAAAAENGARSAGSAKFSEVTDAGQVVAAVSLPRATSVEFVAGTSTLSGPGFLWTSAGTQAVGVSIVLTDDPDGDSFSITAGTYAASGPVVKGEIRIGSN